MTISSTNRKAGPFVGNDSSTSFPFTFKVFQAADIYVVRLNASTNVETVLVLGTDYTVSLNANQNSNPGGTLTLSTGALATGTTLTITSNVTPLQQTDLTNQGGFYPAVITNALDKLTILVQQALERLGRSLTLPLSTPAGVSTSLPPPQSNALIAWNQSANAFQNVDPTTMATIVAFGTANADVFVGDGVWDQQALSANPGSLNNLDVSVGGVTQEPGLDYTWVDGTTITFTTPPPLGVRVLVRYMRGLPQGYTTADLVQYAPTGVGASLRTAQDKLRESVSVKDFGARGDGVTDDTAAIQAAISAIKVSGNLGRSRAPRLFFPFGTYLTSITLDIDSGSVMLVGENSTIKYVGAGTAVQSGNAAYLTNLSAGYFYVGVDGLTIECTNTSAKCFVNLGYRKIEFLNAYLKGGAIGLETEGAWASSVFYNSTCQNQSSHGIHIKQRNNQFTLENSAVLGAGGNGVLLSTSGAELKGIKFWGVDIEGCAGAANITGNTGNVAFESCWFESNTLFNIRLSNDPGDSNKYGISIRNSQITGSGVDVLIGTSTTGTLIDGVEISNNEFADSDLVVIGGNKVSGFMESRNAFTASATKTLPVSGLSNPVSTGQPLFETAPTEPFGFGATGRQGEFRYSATTGRVWLKASGGSAAGGWLLLQGQRVNDYANQLASLPTGATPSVLNRMACRTVNAGATSITSFLDGYASQEILLVGTDGGNTTVAHGTNIRLAGGANFVIGDNDTIRLLCVDGAKWVEVSRSNNT